jgi:tRNA threonylcarbamoyladenosine biosynthesis protein TsaE
MMQIPPGTLLLYGGIGTGKTTLTRSIVEALPGGRMAEIASPSFTVCNIYCTTPQVRHFDLYRLAPGASEEALEESFDDASVLTIVEWPERVNRRDLPKEALTCLLTRLPEEDSRSAELSAVGSSGTRCLEAFRSLYLPA